MDDLKASSCFDPQEYLKANLDVKLAGIDPFVHWEEYGKKEGRRLSFRKELSMFEKDGYVVIKESLGNNFIAPALSAIEGFKQQNLELWERNTDINGFVRRVTNLHRHSKDIQALFSKNIAAKFCDYVFTELACIYTSLFFEAGSEQPIHRDTPYFHTKPVNRFVGFWIALEDVTLHNGPIQLVPGGHKSEEIDLEEIGRLHYANLSDINPNCMKLWNTYQKLVKDKCDAEGLEALQIEMKKGDTLVWHPMLPHGGSPIANPRLTRKSIVFHITPENTPVYQQDAFFNPKKELNDFPNWSYTSISGRKVALIGNSVQFPGSYNGKRDEVLLQKP